MKKRLLLLYGPSFTMAVWAVLFAMYERTDRIAITGCVALAIALGGHTYQEVRDINASRTGL